MFSKQPLFFHSFSESLQVFICIESQACGFCSWLHLFPRGLTSPGCLEEIHPRKAWDQVGRCGLTLEPLLASNSHKCSFVQKRKESHHSDFFCRFSELHDSAVVLDADMLSYKWRWWMDLLKLGCCQRLCVVMWLFINNSLQSSDRFFPFKWINGII